MEIEIIIKNNNNSDLVVLPEQDEAMVTIQGLQNPSANKCSEEHPWLVLLTLKITYMHG